MGEWPRKTIGDLVLLQRGIDLPDAERRPGSVPIMGSFGITGRHSEAACRGPGVTVGRSGASAGVVCYIDEDFWPLNTCLYVRDFKGNNPRFVYYLLKTFDLASLNSGSAQPSLNRNFVHPIPAAFPDVHEQKAIASILGALDDKIELNRRMNETLEAIARAIFKDWFVDFGPTRTKMALRGEDPQKENVARAPYLAADIWSLFPDRLDDDGKPDGWTLGTLGDVARQVGEATKPEALDPDTPYIGLEHMPRKSITLSDWEGAGKVTSGKLAFRRGDFLFGKLRPYFHKVGIAPIDGICSTDIVVLHARKRKAAAFVLACISQDEFVTFTDRTSDGTKMPRTSWGRMERYGLCIPSEAALAVYSSCVDPMLDRIIANIHESRTLAATRDLLLPKLMSGEIRVRDADSLLGDMT